MSSPFRTMKREKEREAFNQQKQTYLDNIRKHQRECEDAGTKVQVEAMVLLDFENKRPIKTYEEYLNSYKTIKRDNLANGLSVKEILNELENRLRLNQIAFASEVKKNRIGLCCQDGEKVRQLVGELDRLGLIIMEKEKKTESKQQTPSKEELKGTGK